MRTRMTKVDWHIVNEALAYWETMVEDDPTHYTYGLSRVRRCRFKVFERLHT